MRIIASMTLRVASVQSFTVASYRSCSVMRPRWNCRSISATFVSASSIIFCLSLGMATSSIEMETPATVAALKPIVLIRSTTSAVISPPQRSKTAVTISRIAPRSRILFTKRSSSGSTALNSTRPTVVSTTPPLCGTFTGV